jgi:hypothetical protein
MPRSLGFNPSKTGVYEDKQPPDLPAAIAEVASNPKPGQDIAFEISGEGALQDQNQNASDQGQGSNSSASPEADNRPGGGLGKPGEDPDPLDQYRWWLLGAFGIVLAGGAVYTTSRSKAPVTSPAPAAGPDRSAATLLDALKEELFQLELEHQQAQISDQEYATAKAALDQTLARAIKRNK